MINHNAFGVQTAGARARIHAFVILAGELCGTLGASYALGPTSRWGANVGGQARAYSLTRYLFALAVGSTG